MQTLKQGVGVEERDRMTKLADRLSEEWQTKVANECPQVSEKVRDSIVRWLLGEVDRFDSMLPNQVAIARQAMDYRYRILQQRYLGVSPERAYRNLTNRLGSLVMLRNKIKTWVSLSRDRSRAVADVLQEVIQELLNSDRYIQQQISWISQCTTDPRLRDALLLTSVEEYCLRPIRNQPLLVYRFVNYLRRSQRGGMTHVPEGELVRLVSDEVMFDEADSPLSLLDVQAVSEYQDNQALEDQQAIRQTVQQEFEAYLEEKLGKESVQWLRLYLQGRTQEAIAQAMNLPIKQIYRLREKVSYHAVRGFALKGKSELVANWLQISLQEHNLGLTPSQWQTFLESSTPEQQQLLAEMKAGKTLEAIAHSTKATTAQLMGEWSKLYLAAQALRSND